MDRTEIKSNGAGAQPLEEPFWVQDPATGKKRLVREMLGPELARCLANVRQNDVPRAQVNIKTAIIALVSAERLQAVLEYEIARRAHTIVVAPN